MGGHGYYDRVAIYHGADWLPKCPWLSLEGSVGPNGLLQINMRQEAGDLLGSLQASIPIINCDPWRSEEPQFR